MEDTLLNPRRRYILWVVIIAIGAAGIAIKEPFGLFMMHVMGIPVPGNQSIAQFFLHSEWGWLILAAIGTFIFWQYSGLRSAPFLERLLFRDTRTAARPPIWRPALIAALVCTLFFAAFQIAGLTPPLVSKMGLGHISHADQTKLFMLYPLADIGAALSEEVIYRFGIIATLMGLLALVRVSGKNPTNAVAFWVANIIQAAFFGFIHVQQGAVTAQIGSIWLTTALAAPTWSGVVLGYVYRRFGIETAMVTHMAADIMVPIFLALWALVHH